MRRKDRPPKGVGKPDLLSAPGMEALDKEARAAEAARWEAVRVEIEAVETKLKARLLELEELESELAELAICVMKSIAISNDYYATLEILCRHTPATTAETGEAAKEAM